MLKAKAKEAGRCMTVGEDKAYGTADHVAKLCAINGAAGVRSGHLNSSPSARPAE